MGNRVAGLLLRLGLTKVRQRWLVRDFFGVWHRILFM